MPEKSDDQQKDELLSGLLRLIAKRGIAKKWAVSDTPYSDLVMEGQNLFRNESYKESIRKYVETKPVILQTVETLLAHAAMLSSVSWKDVPVLLQPIARQGWHFGRWLPTFLVIDGPLGHFLRDSDSPITKVLKSDYAVFPKLAEARDAFNNDLFRQVRNGVGHWSFVWRVENGIEEIVMIDWETGNPTTKITLLEGEALHLLSFSVIEVLDQEILRPAIR